MSSYAENLLKNDFKYRNYNGSFFQFSLGENSIKFDFINSCFSKYLPSFKQYSIKDFALVNTVYVSYAGGRNKSFESIAKRSEGGFVLFTEKDPVWMFELNEQLQETGRAKWNLPGDISAATFHNNALWLLSDERAEIWLTDLVQKSIVKRFKLPVLNPEGIAFLPNGTLLILSDDEHRLYFFNDFNTTSDEKK
jgi:uncharacterized protein YjiK